jgi:hypothetical protein
MTLYIATMLGWGTAGAALAEILQYYYIRQQGRQFDLRKAGIIVLATGIGTLLYYVYVENQSAAPLQAMHYGVFLALTIEEYLDFIHEIGTAPEPQKQTAGASTVGGAQHSGTLILNGFLPVYGIGCFGAFLAEFVRIRSSRKKPSDFTTSDWVLSALYIVASGLVTALHGVANVNALTALQLGAAGPLVIKRIKR